MSRRLQPRQPDPRHGRRRRGGGGGTTQTNSPTAEAGPDLSVEAGVPLCINDQISLDDSNNFPPNGATLPSGAVVSKCQGIGFVGNVGSPVEWVAKNATFVVTDRLAVNSALTIKPGVTVKFALTGSNADGIWVGTGGTIVADGGSNTTPINFTSIRNTTVDGNNSSGTTLLPAVGDWEGIFVMSAGSTFNFCNFSYSGSTYDYSDQAALVIQAGQTTVTNCSFDYNLVGLDLTGQGSGNTISGNGFSHNGTDHLP